MKIKTSELTGNALIYAVALAEGHHPKYFGSMGVGYRSDHGKWVYPRYLDWAQGGPIIEREHISFDNFKGHPCAAFMGDHARYTYRNLAPEGQTLIAAMRCYTASKLGDEVDIPEELK